LKVKLVIQDDKTQKILGANRSTLMALGRIGNLDVGTEGNFAKCAVAPVQHKDMLVKVVIPLEGLVDFNEEIKRIQKTIEKLNKDIAGLSSRLSNEKFVKNAEEEVVLADRELLEKSKTQLVQLQEALIRFQ
ncbi:MAG: valine--tRNA ligase, partial [Bdellovibrionales bacterium]